MCARVKTSRVRREIVMAEKVWMVEVQTWELRLMYPVDAKEAVRLGDYAYAPVGGYDLPSEARSAPERPRTVAA
jgi:hypothetical protein